MNAEQYIHYGVDVDGLVHALRTRQDKDSTYIFWSTFPDMTIHCVVDVMTGRANLVHKGGSDYNLVYL